MWATRQERRAAWSQTAFSSVTDRGFPARTRRAVGGKRLMAPPPIAIVPIGALPIAPKMTTSILKTACMKSLRPFHTFEASLTACSTSQRMSSSVVLLRIISDHMLRLSAILDDPSTTFAASRSMLNRFATVFINSSSTCPRMTVSVPRRANSSSLSGMM